MTTSILLFALTVSSCTEEKFLLSPTRISDSSLLTAAQVTTDERINRNMKDIRDLVKTSIGYRSSS
ncbi:MAG: hypothetical protein U0T81_03815 [Saprospiraceae bacterium]